MSVDNIPADQCAPLGGLALMALDLAAKRAGYIPTHLVPREDAEWMDYAPASKEYYRILDRIASGEKP